MSERDLRTVEESLVEAGLEIYRVQSGEIQIAERVRLHIMDSGIRVRISSAMEIAFTAKSQRSDFPSVAPEALFEKVRSTVGRQALGRGYQEEGSQTVEVKDPMDASRVLDTWHEVTYAKPVNDPQQVIDEVRWALGVEKYISP